MHSDSWRKFTIYFSSQEAENLTTEQRENLQKLSVGYCQRMSAPVNNGTCPTAAGKNLCPECCAGGCHIHVIQAA